MAGSISTLGVGSGLQLQDILDKLRAADQQVLDKKKTDITTAQAQIDEFTTVNNKLLALKSAALNLSLSSTFLGRTVSSSSESTLTATVSDGATVKSTAVTVTNLAQKSSRMSLGVSSPDSVVTADALVMTLRIGNNESSLSLAAGTTMNQLMTKIKEATDNPGLTASIINDGDSAVPYKLVLTANNFGEDNRITINPNSNFTDQPPGTLNAKFTVDGIPYQRQTNAVNDILPGVTLNLTSTGSSTVTVANNDSGLKDSITTLITSYNDAVQELRGKSGYDPQTGTFGILNNTTLRDLPFDLEGLMTTTNSANGNIRSLFDLGLTFNRDGSITVDDTVLSAAVSAHSDGIKSFFLGDPANDVEGLADQINNRLRTMTGGTGIVAGEKTAAQSRIDSLNAQLAEGNDRLNKKYDLLTQQFVALDAYMNQMTSMSNFLTGQFKSLSDGWSSNSSSN